MTVASHEVQATTASPFLEVQEIRKSFGSTRALDGVSMDVRASEIHALLGHNGSGKSTLIKVLAGVQIPDGGQIRARGKTYDAFHARRAHHSGFRFIHQDLGLVSELSCAENFLLGGSTAAWGWWSESRSSAALESLFIDHGLNVSPSTLVRALSPAQRTVLAILRAMSDMPEHGGLLVLDEPTATLPPSEVAHLFMLLRGLRTRGVAILYVTHRLDEVFELTDRLTVLRDGRVVTTRTTSGLGHKELVELIVGSTSQDEPGPPEPILTDGGPPAITVHSLRGGRVRDLSFDARAGEILGITGLVGSGHEDALGLIFGRDRRQSGEVSIVGTAIDGKRPSTTIDAGAGYLPADRDRLATIPEWTSRENLTLPRIPTRLRRLIVDPRKDRSEARRWIGLLRVSPPNAELPISKLSGGNRQRIVLGRWLRMGNRVLLLEEPTNGVDIAGGSEIHGQVRSEAVRGACVVVSSSDLDEIEAICSRVLILRDGRLYRQLEGAEITHRHLLSAVMGAPADESAPARDRPQELLA